MRLPGLAVKFGPLRVLSRACLGMGAAGIEVNCLLSPGSNTKALTERVGQEVLHWCLSKIMAFRAFASSKAMRTKHSTD